MIQINLIGTFNVVRLAAEAIARSRPGASGERRAGQHGVGSGLRWAGGADRLRRIKGGVVSMTLPIARDLAPLGIRVMTIAPGIFATPMLAGLPEAAQLSLGQQVPFPSHMKPENARRWWHISSKTRCSTAGNPPRCIFHFHIFNPHILVQLQLIDIHINMFFQIFWKSFYF